MSMLASRRGTLALTALACALCAPSAFAVSFSVPFGEESLEGVLNTTFTGGAAWRTQARSSDLVGKADNNPNLCGRTASGAPQYQSCQGLFRTQVFPAQRLSGMIPDGTTPTGGGQFTINNDDGNLNYDKWDIVQAPLKITQDLTLSYGDFGFFVKGLYFYDLVNNKFTMHHPNMITRDNYQQVGVVSTLPTDIPPRSDSAPCPAVRNDGHATGPGPCGIVYGRGAAVDEQRNDGETLRQIGTDLQLLDAYFYGTLPLPFEKELSFKVGRQNLNWGESTLLVFDSINTVNPVNANNFFRTGFQVEEVFQPVGMVVASTEPFENTTLEAFYQYEWLPLEAPAPGSYYSFVDLGTNNAVNYFNIGFGGSADDPDQMGRLLDNPLSGLTNTTSTGYRLPDNEPEDGGQYGASLKYYAEWLNNGTELGLYFMNYHSRIPMISTWGVPESCAKHTTSTVEFLVACSDIPLTHQVLDMNNPGAATDSAVNFDDLRIQFEYPENIQMYGFSFNTTAGDLSFQGEVAYRPEEPLQVDLQDLVFGAFGPTLSNCDKAPGCTGTGTGLGNVLNLLPPELRNLLVQTAAENCSIINPGPGDCPVGGIGTAPGGGTIVYPSSDFVVDAEGNHGAYPDTYDLLVGHMVGSPRAFPSFVIPYRGDIIGQNASCQQGGHYTNNTYLAADGTRKPLDRNAPCYIRGWETFQTFEFDLGATYVLGATDNHIGADQIIMLFETGATYVPDLPPLDVLQLEAPGTDTHASAGADGTGADRSRQACSTNPACSFGADGGRFNPHQQDPKYFPDKLSWGYDVIMLIRYESVLPGISIELRPVFQHNVRGTAPGLATNFIEGRKIADLGMEIRYKSAISFNLGYQWFTGGGDANLVADRDNARAYVKYQF
jgi:hypothetical protein